MAHGFRFKRFGVSHDGPAMKVGTDGVLLGAWCTVREGTERALDVGTGTGLIALMLAQRGEGWGMAVDAVEVDAGVAGQAEANVQSSPWSGRVRVINSPVQDFGGSGYGLVVSNPPYFEESLLPPEPSRMAARHTRLLTHDELAASAARLLAPDGIFAMVLPHAAGEDFIAICREAGLHLHRQTTVRTTPAAEPKRTLMEFGRETVATIAEDTLVVQTAPERYTAEYMALTRDFYLKF